MAMPFIKRPIRGELTQSEEQFSKVHDVVFGSMGALHYELEGNVLTVFDGGVLLGGGFYDFKDEQSFTIKGASRFLCVQLDKYELGTPEFVIEKQWEGDSATHYKVAVLAIKTANGIITKVEKIGGNLPEVYNLLDKATRSNSNKIKNLDEKVATVDSRLTTVDNKVSTTDTKVQGIDTRVKNVETKTTDTNTKVQGIDTRMKSVETKIGTIDTSVRNQALYKHAIFIKFSINSTEFLNGPINMLFDVYTSRSTPFINNPNSAGTPHLIEQIKMALYDGQPSSEMRMSVTGDFTVDYIYLRAASLWGVSFSTNHQFMRMYYKFEPASDRSIVLGSVAGQTKYFITKTNGYSEKIIRVL